MGRKAKISMIDEKDMGKNPFVDKSFIIQTKRIYKNKRYVEVESINVNDDVISYGSVEEIKNSFVVESENFTKVFTKAGLRIHVMSLSSRARDLYLWLIYELNPGKDYVYIDEKRYMLECNVSLNTFKAALADLIKELFIVNTAYKEVYWINPLFFFNGSRYEKYKDHVVEK